MLNTQRFPRQAVLKMMAMLATGWVGVVVVSCTAAGAPTPDLPTSPPATAISFPAPESASDRERNRVVNEAVQFAARGCTGTELLLSGPPTRIQTASTSLSKAGGLGDIALATPELTAPIINDTLSREIRRSATRLPVAGVVSVSM